MRVIEIFVPNEKASEAEAAVREHGAYYVKGEHDGRTHLEVVIPYGAPDELLEDLEGRIELEEGKDVFVIVNEPVSIRPRDEEKEEHQSRLAARDEIETMAEEGARFRNRSFLVFSSMAALIASGGLLMNNIAVIVGAMVIAPVLRPLVGVATGVALGRPRLALRATLSLVVSLGIAFAVGALLGWVSPVVRLTGSLEGRSSVTMYDALIALGAGVAAGYSVIRNERSAMIGIVVAASIVPAACAAGIGLTSGHHALATGSGLIVAINVVAILLAVVAVFRVEQLRSEVFRERKSGQRLSNWTIWIASALLLLLLVPLGWTFWLDFRAQGQVQTFLEELERQGERGDGPVRSWQWIDDGRTLIVYTDGAPPSELMAELHTRATERFPSAPIRLLFVPTLAALPDGS